MLFSEPKIPQFRVGAQRGVRIVVSVLFSEPKIPQSSPTSTPPYPRRVSVLFSDPKIPQWSGSCRVRTASASFSALQRAENSSIVTLGSTDPCLEGFQCSSASRKFLNECSSVACHRVGQRFQCSSASRKFLNSVALMMGVLIVAVSVLFSEPKIPQCEWIWRYCDIEISFSALQRAENSSIETGSKATTQAYIVSVLFSEPKIPQFWCTHG